MPLPHRGITVNEYLVSVMNNPVHNRLGDRTVILRIRVNPPVPAFSLKLSTENSRSMLRPRFDDLKQIVGLLRIETSDQPLVKNQQINLLVGFDHLLELIVCLGVAKLIKQLRHSYIPHREMLPASRLAKRTGKICLSVPACSLEDDVVFVLYVLTGREQREILSAQFPVLIVLNPFNSGVRD